MRILIIGAVAAGTSAGAKARRNDEDAEIVIYEKDRFISYSGCGMPYYLGGIINDVEELSPRDPEFFKSKYNIDVMILHEVLAIDLINKKLSVRNLSSGDVFEDYFDKLVISTGAVPFIPKIKGNDSKNVFTLRNINDVRRIKGFIDKNKPAKAVIAGTGFIGLEVCENLKKVGIEVLLIEMKPKVTPNLDEDMAIYVKEHIEKNGVKVLTNTIIDEITDSGVYILNNSVKKQINSEKIEHSEKTFIEADMVILATGIKPEVTLAKNAGITLGLLGAIKVNNKMQTNFPDVYACGDCIEQFNLVTGNAIYAPLGSTANKTGRIAGDSLTGGNLEFKGILGTAIFRIFDMTVAQTGLTENEAKKLEIDIAVCHNIKPDKPEYMGGEEMVIKAIADKSDGRLLGVQIVGFGGTDKRIDVFATAITFNAKVWDLAHLDLAYAPPFSTTKDPVMYTGMILENSINNDRPLITSEELDKLIKSNEKYKLIDARVPSQYEKNHIDSAQNIPHSKIRDMAQNLDKEITTITYCNKGVTGNAAQNILINKGFKKVFNLSGGHKQFKITPK